MPTYSSDLGNGYTLNLVLSLVSQDETLNRSTIAWALNINQTGTYEVQSSYNNPWSVTVNGTKVGSGTKQYNFFNYNGLTLGSGNTTVNHNSDGSKTVSASGTFEDLANLLNDRTSSGSWVLPVIPRGSTPRLSDATVDAGQTITVYTDRASTSFTHTIYCNFGGTIFPIGTGVTDSVTWTVDMNTLLEIPNAASGTGAVIIETYSGSTLVGTKSTGITISAPASVVPTITSISHSEATAGVNANVGKYVQNISKLALTINGEAGVYGSTITARKITVAGQTINADSGTTPAVINASGLSVPIVATVTDSRGRTKSITQNVEVLAYTPPKINSTSVQRSNSAGTPDESGAYLRINLNASVSSLVNSTQRNQLRYTIYIRTHGTTAWGTAKSNVLLPVGTTSFNSYVNLGTYSSATAYDVKIDVSDDFQTISNEQQVPTAQIAMHWKGNDGVGIGKYHTNGTGGSLDVMGQIYQNNGIAVLDAADFATQAQAEAGTVNTTVMTPLRTAQAIDAQVPRIYTAVEAVASVASGASLNQTYTLPAGLFSVAPVVQATTTIDRHEVVVSSVTTTSVVLRFTNRTAAASAGNVHITAIGF